LLSLFLNEIFRLVIKPILQHKTAPPLAIRVAAIGNNDIPPVIGAADIANTVNPAVAVIVPTGGRIQSP
jgi:hypothetical protein